MRVIADWSSDQKAFHVAWGKVMVETWTHKIQGLHRNDFILAAKTNALLEQAPKR